MLSSSTGNTAVDDNDDGYEGVHVDDSSTKDDDDDGITTASNAIAVRHRGGFSLSTSSFMPIFFIIQLYALLQVGFGGSTAGFY